MELRDLVTLALRAGGSICMGFAIWNFLHGQHLNSPRFVRPALVWVGASAVFAAVGSVFVG